MIKGCGLWLLGKSCTRCNQQGDTSLNEGVFFVAGWSAIVGIGQEMRISMVSDLEEQLGLISQTQEVQ